MPCQCLQVPWYVTFHWTELLILTPTIKPCRYLNVERVHVAVRREPAFCKRPRLEGHGYRYHDWFSLFVPRERPASCTALWKRLKQWSPPWRWITSLPVNPGEQARYVPDAVFAPYVKRGWLAALQLTRFRKLETGGKKKEPNRGVSTVLHETSVSCFLFFPRSWSWHQFKPGK